MCCSTAVTHSLPQFVVVPDIKLVMSTQVRQISPDQQTAPPFCSRSQEETFASMIEAKFIAWLADHFLMPLINRPLGSPCSHFEVMVYSLLAYSPLGLQSLSLQSPWLTITHVAQMAQISLFSNHFPIYLDSASSLQVRQWPLSTGAHLPLSCNWLFLHCDHGTFPSGNLSPEL